MDKALKIEIRKLGPIGGLDLEVAPGAHLLVGPAGSGKSTALQAIMAATTTERPPQASWGQIVPRGSVVVSGGDGGAEVRVGSRVQRIGHCGIPAIDLGTVLNLADPGVSSSKLAAKARDQAFAALTGAKASPFDLVGVGSTDTMPLPDAAEAARLTLLEHRREALRRADEASGRAVGLESQVEDVPKGLPSVADAEAAARDADMRATQAATSAEMRRRMEAKQAKAREGHGERPDVEHAIFAEAKALSVLTAARDALAAAQRAEADAASAYEGARRDAAAADKAAEEWDRVEALLSEPVEGVTDEEEATAKQAADAARETLTLARSAERAAKVREQLKAAVAEAEKAKAEVKDLEALKDKRLPEAVAEVLAGLNVPGWVIGEDGLMCADPTRDGELVPFDALSDGIRLTKALELALGGREGAALLVLPQERGAALHPPQWAEIDRIARERGLYVLSADKGEGDLRLVSVGDGGMRVEAAEPGAVE